MTSPLPGARSALALLLAINLFNYLDRQVLSAVLAKIKLDASMMDPADPWLQTKLGLLSSAFMVAYMVFAPLFGWLDGRGVRRWVILGLGVTGWSIASGCSGLASGYWLLLLTRCCVGIGEGAYGPVASAMLSDVYPAKDRGRVMAWFNMAIPVGSALGFVVGAVVGDWLGWRPAFLFTFSGLVLGLLCFVRKEFPRPAVVAKGGPGYLAVLKQLRGNRSFVLCCLGMTAVTFVMGGVAAWLPVYVFEREARFVLNDDAVKKRKGEDGFMRSDGLPAVPPTVTEKLKASGDEQSVHQLRERLKQEMGDDDFRQYSAWVIDAATAGGSLTSGRVSLIFGVLLVVAGLTATPLGAWLAGRLQGRVRGPFLLVSGVGALAAFPFVVGLLFVPFPWAWGCAFVAVFGLFLYTGPAFTLLANVTTPAIRATAFAINILVIHALGDAISPAILGAVADVSDLHTAILGSSALILVGGGLWLWGMRYEAADTARAQ
jgi:MFS transporter, Spinster family, sphingosine-1-phosphate transporter